MGMTITEKILARAGGTAKVAPGDVAVVDVETACLLDLSFLPEGWREVLTVADPSKVVIVFDHLAPAPTVQAAENMRTGRAFAKRFGIERLHDIGPDQGISHAIIADNAYALPGTVLVNADFPHLRGRRVQLRGARRRRAGHAVCGDHGQGLVPRGGNDPLRFHRQIAPGRLGQGHLPAHRRQHGARTSTRTSNMAGRACRASA